MVTSEAQEIKKQETLVRFSIISYKTRLSVTNVLLFGTLKPVERRASRKLSSSPHIG